MAVNCVKGSGYLSMRISFLIVVTTLLLLACTGTARPKIVPPTAGVITSQDSVNSSQEAADNDRTVMIDGFLKRLADVADSGAMLEVVLGHRHFVTTGRCSEIQRRWRISA